MIFRRGLKDYRMYEDEEGRERYRYTGAYYTLQMSETQSRAARRGLLAAALCAAGATYWTGRAAGGAFSRLYAVIPFLFAVFFAGWGLTGAFNLVFQKGRMTLNQYTIGVKRLKRCMVGLAAASGTTAIGIAFTGAGFVLPAVLSAALSGGTFLYIHKKICICISEQQPET